MNTQTYDELFEERYDKFIEESNTEDLRNLNAEELETFLHNVARTFYDYGRNFEFVPKSTANT